MAMKLTDDIRSVTELKRKTREILDQVRQTGRPVVLTVNGKADAVLMDVEQFLTIRSPSRINATDAPISQPDAAGIGPQSKAGIRDRKPLQ
jgi:prevent-host-death family protein